MPVETLLAYIVTVVLIELTPGPNMGYLAILTLAEGRRAGLAAVAGVALGLALLAAAAALGLTALLTTIPLLWQVLRWGGVGFLLWLAWDGWRDAGAGVEAQEGTAPFLRGLIANVLNPKAGLFYLTVQPRFLSEGAPVAGETMLLSAFYVGIATAIHVGIVVLAGHLRPLFSAPARLRLVRRVLAVLLALVALWLAWTTSA